MFYFARNLTILQKSKRQHLFPRKSTSTQLNLLLWWRHNIYLWRHNGARQHARAKHYEYFVFENCTQTTGVYRRKNPIESLYIYSWQINLKLNWAIFFNNHCIFSNVWCLCCQSVPHWLMYNHCASVSPIIYEIIRFFHLFVDSCIGTNCHHKLFTGQVLLWERILFHIQKYFFWQETFPQMGRISSCGTAKSWNHRGRYWTLNLMARIPLISHPRAGCNPVIVVNNESRRKPDRKYLHV